MSLATLNKTVRISSSVLTGVDGRDSIVFMSRLNRDDFNVLSGYVNNVAVQAFKALTSSPQYPHDALDKGISGMTIVTYPEDLGNSFKVSEMFWKKGATIETGRPCTIKESFDYVLSNLTQQIVQVVEKTEDITGLIDELRCASLNNISLKNEILGTSYPLMCNGETIGEYPLAKHIYELFNQVIGGHNIANLEYLDNGASYPNLNFELPNIIVPEATEEISGTVQVASVANITSVAGPIDSISGSSYLAVTTEALYNSLKSDAVNTSVGEINLFRDKVKEVAFEKLTESSIFDLSDTDRQNNLLSKQALIYDAVAGKFINRNIVWSDIQMRPSVTEPVLYSETQNSTIVNTKQDYTDEEKIELLKSHNTLSYKKSSGKWEIEAYKAYKGLSPAISYGADPFKSTLAIPGYLNKKIPFTVCFAYKNNRYYESSSGDYVQYLDEAGEEVDIFDEIENGKSRVMSSNTQWWESNENAFYNLNSDAVGIYRSDKSYLRTTGSKFLNTNKTENTSFSIYKNLTTETDIITEGESLVMVLGPYECSDKLYTCPSYINRRYGLLNKEVTFCVSDTFISNNDFRNYILGEGINESGYALITSQILSNQNFIGIVTKKYNRNSSVGGRVTTPPPFEGVIDFGLNLSDSHKLCTDLLDINRDFSTGIEFYEFIDKMWTAKYGSNKDYFNQTQRESIAKLVEFSLAYCKLKL